MHEDMSNYPRGHIAVSGENTHLYGQCKQFPDIDWDSTDTVKPRTSGMNVGCRWVKNGEASDAILPRKVLTWDTGSAEPGTVVIECGDDGVPCGVADEFMVAAGAAAGEGFWMVTGDGNGGPGPTELITDGATTLATTDEVVSAADGEINKQTAAPADATACLIQVNSRVGRPLAAVTNVADTTFRALVGPFFA